MVVILAILRIDTSSILKFQQVQGIWNCALIHAQLVSSTKIFGYFYPYECMLFRNDMPHIAIKNTVTKVHAIPTGASTHNLSLCYAKRR